MAINFDKITRCQIIKVLGATECVNCEHLVKCWGEEAVLPELSDIDKLFERS